MSGAKRPFYQPTTCLGACQLPLMAWVVFSVIQGLPESSAVAVTEIERGGVINHPVFFLACWAALGKVQSQVLWCPCFAT